MLLAGLIWPGIGVAEIDRDLVVKVKSAFVLNFIRFAQWPDETFEDENAPIHVAVVGEDPLGKALDLTLDGEQVHDRPITLARHPLPRARDEDWEETLAETVDDLRHAQLVYLGQADGPVLEKLIASLPKHTLTVGDRKEHLQYQSMLALGVEGDRVVFFANFKRIEAMDVTLSSRLLRLARKAEE